MNVWENSLQKPPLWMIVPTFYPEVGGAQNQVEHLSKALMKTGWPITVLTRRHGYVHSAELSRRDSVNGIPVHRIYSRGLGKLDSLLYLVGGVFHLLRNGRRGIYHAHDISAAGWLAIVARYLLGGRCLIKLRTGVTGYQDYLSSSLTRWQFIAQMKLADRIVVVSKELESMLEEIGVPSARVVRVPNAVNTQRFRPPTTTERDAARARIAADGRTLFLYVGRLAPHKGGETLLTAWARLPQGLRDRCRLLIVGDGPQREQLRQLIASRELEHSVSMLGMQREVRPYYWASDVYVLPSDTEGLSNTLLEAMASGLPVIASNVGGALDVVNDGHNGLLFESGDPDQLCHRIIALLKQRSQWSQIGLRGRDTVLGDADLPVTMSRFQSLYDELVAEMVDQTATGHPKLSS